jgi:predicted phosphodiesterase
LEAKFLRSKLAVISDIHGNRWALEAVLKDIRQRNIDDVVNLGDSLYGPLDPGGTAKILIELKIKNVLGNQDRIILENSTESERSLTLNYVQENLNSDHLHWLKSLKSTTTFKDEFFLCHGTPFKDDEYLLESVSIHGVTLKKISELVSDISSLKQRVILCGHSHIFRSVYLPDKRLIINAGGVGLPAYCDEKPYPHKMESGSPYAKYCIVSRDDSVYLVELIEVPYNWSKAAEIASANNREDWAQWLRTGRAELQWKE